MSADPVLRRAAPLLWLALWCTVGFTAASPGLGGVVAGAAAVLIAAMLALRRIGTAAGATNHTIRTGTLRERARRTGVLRQSDPDAAGRTRSRAPSNLPLAA